jgi:hypothetical protein
VFLADPHPAAHAAATRIAELVSFELARPRSPEAVADPEFVRVKAHALECSGARNAVMTRLALDTFNLTKRFGAFTALDGVSLAVRPARCTRCSARTAPARARW